MYIEIRAIKDAKKRRASCSTKNIDLLRSAARNRGCIRFDYFHVRKELLRRRIKRQVTQVKETKREREKNRERERGKEREIEWDRRRAFKSPISKAERSQRRRSCASTRESARADKMSSRRGSERCHHRVIYSK